MTPTHSYQVGNENILRLTVKDIPFSVDNSVIVDELEKRKYKVSGKVMLPKLRVDGQLTNCLTGDRVIYIERPTQPVPRLISFGVFCGKVFHANQAPKDQTSVICSKREKKKTLFFKKLQKHTDRIKKESKDCNFIIGGDWNSLF